VQSTLSGRLSELHRFILNAFANTGRSPASADIQQRFSLSTESEVERLLAELEKTKAIHRAPGDPLVTHAYPFTSEPTPQRVTLASGVRVYSMCAVDALGIPLMLNTDVQIESECLGCKQAVVVNVRNGRIAHHAPDTLIVGYVPLACCATPATEQCPHVNFFCSREHLNDWAKDNPNQELKSLTLDQALEQGKRSFGSMLTGSSASCCS